MNKKDYLNKIKYFKGKPKKIMINQIECFYDIKDLKIEINRYSKGDKVLLSKNTLMHGTYKNAEGLKEIIQHGLISADFIEGRKSKYPSCVGVWNLKEECYLSEYINKYSGGTIEYMNNKGKVIKTEVIPYNQMSNIMNRMPNNTFRWYIEQTKEARFLPSLVQDKVQIGIIFNNNKYLKELLKGDILKEKNVSDKDVKAFVNPEYYQRFLKERKNKNDFFTDRESAVLFGIPSNFIEGILVGRKYEKNNTILNDIKKKLPDCYICNLDGRVIVGNK